jgi:ubiquitin fusion degradation protein 1
VLDTLIRLNIQYPMMFKLSNLDPDFQHTTHAGVLEFLAEEGKAYLPQWVSIFKKDDLFYCLFR